MMASENKNKKLFRVVVLKPGKQRSQASIVLFHSRPGQPKKRVFNTQHFTPAMIPRLTGHGSPPNLERVCSTKLRVLSAKFEGRRWSVSRGLAWDVGA